MADYSMVIGSKFSPFSFEELLKPALMATQAHQELENQYSELATKANVWDEMANEQTDPYAYNMYKKYSDDLKNQADILASQGLTPASRKALVAMKNRYSSEITPIETAYNKRQSLIDQQREALLKDDTLMFDTDYSTVSLDTLIKNPNATFTPLSGEAIAKRTAAMAKEAASTMLNDPEYKTVFNSQYVQQKIMQGYDMSQIIAAAQRDPNAPKALLGIVDTIKGQVGYNKWSNDNKKKIDSYINEGLKAAAGSPKIDIMSNKNYESDIDRERMELAREEFDYQTKGVKSSDGSYYKPLGAGKIQVTKPDGTIEIIGSTETAEDLKHVKEFEKSINKVNKLSDIKELGFTPQIAVIRSNDGWTYNREGEDIDGVGIWPNTALRTGWWGNTSFKSDKDTEVAVVHNQEDIPGYNEYVKGEGYEHTAFAKILEAATSLGLIAYKYKNDNNGNKSPELDEKGRPILDKKNSRFFTKDVQIVKVKSPRPKGRKGEEYDYLIYIR